MSVLPDSHGNSVIQTNDGYLFDIGPSEVFDGCRDVVVTYSLGSPVDGEDYELCQFVLSLADARRFAIALYHATYAAENGG